MKTLKTYRCFEGTVRFHEHESRETQTKMKFSTFTPEGPIRGCLTWLSGLTCTDENFITKAGALKTLAETGIALVCPDTSPRGLQLPGEHESWDFGSGAGFYVDATTPGYKNHYRMYSYITHELYAWIQEHFGIENQISISGHSMGGHGALVMGLRERGKFKSVSAFSPIVHPTQCDWGKKAFSGYLGSDQKAGMHYDTCELLRAGLTHENPFLIDQGTEDEFLEKQLLTPHLGDMGSPQKINLRYQKGYDHSYYFISTFIAEHIHFHARYLSATRSS